MGKYSGYMIASDLDGTFLGKGGRIVVRPSGTEPLLRVMMEGETEEETLRQTKEVAEQLEAILRKY